MSIPKGNSIVFYDHPCADGASAAWAFLQLYKKKDELVDQDLRLVALPRSASSEKRKAIVRKELDRKSDQKSNVYFVDTQPFEDTLGLVMGHPQVSGCTIIDHHKFHFGELQEYKKTHDSWRDPEELELILDDQAQSAAIMTYNYLFPGRKVPKKLELVGKMEPPVSLETDEEIYAAALLDNLINVNQAYPPFAIETFMELAAQTIQENGRFWYDTQEDIATKILEEERHHVSLKLPGIEKPIFGISADLSGLNRNIDARILDAAQDDPSVEDGIAIIWRASEGEERYTISVRTDPEKYNAKEIADALEKQLHVPDISAAGGHTDSAAAHTTGRVFKERFLKHAKHVNAPDRGSGVSR